MASVSLEAPTVDITVQQGKTAEFRFSSSFEGAPLDLTGYDIRMQVRQTYAATTTLINCTLQNGRASFIDASAGTFRLSLQPDDTSGVNPRLFQEDTLDAVYDIEFQAPSGAVSSGPKGLFTIKREVTR